MKTLLKKLWKDQGGQDLTEYALLLVLLVLTAAASAPKLAQAVNTVFTGVAANVTNGGAAAGGGGAAAQ